MTSSFDVKHPETLTSFILARHHHKQEKGDFCSLMGAIQTASKIISRAVHRAGIDEMSGATEEVNVQGEIVKRMDIVSNETMIHFLVNSGQLCLGASEETEDVIRPPEHLTGEFVVTFDPLDGSSNIDAGVNVGTIFGIYRRISDSGPNGTNPGELSDVLQPAKNLIASGYTMYGASTVLVMAIKGDGVNGFTLDTGSGEFVLTHKNMRIPPKGKIYSINEGNHATWDAITTEYVTQCKSKGPDGAKPFSLRYIGTMVGDVHRTLCYGGIFMYPADSANADGKLRLLYECGPMSMICEEAGGRSSFGPGDVKDIQPVKLHQRCPIFMGSKEDVDNFDKIARK
eukprot:CAMPEP_0177707118 /NCGR_PEP_ID=MMETSP0484_2-20121128/9581_1 /TAXON_ID=354590 /ORGANISM="Rhodomonas lens, Strain RHODO" /LENGTH=341 /DNA_ID=CAMNT_0019218611 /DNA_START=91 /DNA_END=1116 /DNA_ORIENTATION=+